MKKTIEEWKSELIGKKFGKLTVLDIQPHIRKSTNRKDGFEAVCLCDCGKFYTVVTSTLINGNSTSCGCETGRKTKEEWKIELVGKTFGNFLVLDVEDFFTKTGKKKGFCAVMNYPRS